MFDNLTARLSRTVDNLRGRGRITDDNVAETLREVRMALLEADVALPVVKQFIEKVRAKALDSEVQQSLTPGQVFVAILHKELVALMGGAAAGFELRAQPPYVVMLAGLQGAGKTTTAAKLARWLIESKKKRVLLVSTDVRRPAAILQLERLAAQVGAQFFGAEASTPPARIAADALAQAKRGLFDVLIVDTAGRLHVDQELMDEAREIDRVTGAHERLFVVDSMAGQDAVNAARAFGAALDLTGVILTKADGDARGGVALSVREITGKPIVFLGTGEKAEALEPFDPERMATRILGMGDVVALVEQVQKQADVDEAQRLAKKFAQGKGFDFNDLRGQLEQLLKMGGLAAVMDKLPQQVTRGAASKVPGDKDLRRQIAIINSMTRRERRQPGLIDGSRRRRIAGGSGVQVQDVNRLLKQFQDMQRMMKSMKGGRLKRMLGSLKGGRPPGFL
ncbi:MAG TPA: signal recognition particle protein [Steroidobacteraceae bacterium]|nr:signal recognition particle protein [Steroidobacteraceae bacterium]HQX78255.1 signal recognition particle protein [Steroidobacteraceae bacterium]HQZ80124.1 signal recognition particle protein [Steroidobacteraceae bacterium]